MPRSDRLALLMETFDLSLTDIANASGLAISRNQLDRIPRATHDPSPRERQAIAVGVVRYLSERCDSAYLFPDG